jgi:hypothetical protein
MAKGDGPGDYKREVGEDAVSAIDPMYAAPRCGARTRRGTPCMAPAMPNGRCRMHGGKPPGGPIGAANGRYRHGRSAEAIATRRRVRETIRMIRYLLGLL